MVLSPEGVKAYNTTFVSKNGGALMLHRPGGLEHFAIIQLRAVELIAWRQRPAKLPYHLQRLKPARVTLDFESPIALHADLDLVAFL